jgi:hypothetical protein
VGDTHLAGLALLHWRPYTFHLALAVSIIEIAIIVTKFALFLSAPEWTYGGPTVHQQAFRAGVLCSIAGYLVANAETVACICGELHLKLLPMGLVAQDFEIGSTVLRGTDRNVYTT